MIADPLFQVVLVNPEIPQNTGSIGRICCCTECRLHLIEPIAFTFDDRHLKRAGMDYWKQVDCTVHPDWNSLLKYRKEAPVYFFSTHCEQNFWDCPFEKGSFLVFGCESRGLAPEYHEKYPGLFYRIPMPGNFSRSLNLANSVAVAVYEGMRRHRPTA